MATQTKPIHQHFKRLRYTQHKHKLQVIQNERILVPMNNSLESMHQNRRKSLNFHQSQYENRLSSKNDILLKKLLDISNRKKSQYSKTIAYPKIVSFNNPARKKREKMITEMNQQLAQRMINKESHMDYKSMRKSIQEYDRIKKTMYNNKKAMHSSFVQQKSLKTNKNSKVRLYFKSNSIQYEQEQRDNPEYTDL